MKQYSEKEVYDILYEISRAINYSVDSKIKNDEMKAGYVIAIKRSIYEINKFFKPIKESYDKSRN